MEVNQRRLQELKEEKDIDKLAEVFKDEENNIRDRVEAAAFVFGETKGEDIESINFLLTILKNEELELCERVSELLIPIINDPVADLPIPITNDLVGKTGLGSSQVEALQRLLSTTTGERYKIVTTIFLSEVIKYDNPSPIKKVLDSKRHHCSVKPKGQPCDVDIKPVKEYFVAHAFTGEKKNEMRRVIENAIKHLRSDLTPLYADEWIGSEHILCKICQLIQSTEFGIYDMASISKWWYFSKKPIPNPNVTLELGIAYGFGKRAILLIKKGEKPISDTAGFDRIEYKSYEDLEDKLKKKLKL